VTTNTNCKIYPFKFHEGGSEVVAVAWWVKSKILVDS
jgi:hypothetical protein